MIKAIAFDIDNTLIKYGKSLVEESAIAAIDQARNKGMIIIISSGRVYGTMQEDIGQRVKPDYYITVNGGCLNKGDGEIIKAYPMDDAQRQRLTDLCIAHDYPLGFKFANNFQTYHLDGPFVADYCQGPIKRPMIGDNTATRDFHLTHGNPLSAFIYSPQDEFMAKYADEFTGLTFVDLHHTCCEAFPKQVNKGVALAELLTGIGLKLEECMAFGDEVNDVEMLKAAGIGIAMGNGSAGCKAAADYITDDIEADGIYNALKHFAII